jgi:Rps23 Pro-64 3,4-dihydroxylase Tpa1-like proline 4-hydroxylase
VDIQVKEICKIPVVLIKDIFNEDEMDKIWSEIKFIGIDKLLEPDGTGGATDSLISLKKNKGVFLEDVYSTRNFSNYLSLYRNIIDHLIANKEKLVQEHLLLDSFFLTTKDMTLLSYYSNDDYYKSHRDGASWTMIYWIYQEPKLWEGGELLFEQLDLSVEAQSNSCVLFPSFLLHEVVKIQTQNKLENYEGRFSFSTFFHI